MGILNYSSCCYHCSEGSHKKRFVILMKLSRNYIYMHYISVIQNATYMLFFTCLDHLVLKFHNYSQSS